ncbi:MULTISPECIES: hypothetical protein [unclassified Sphingobacterium]|uniref:hypothetical protein n=1 Tax=unclassified Sphingobacterium TaxID=2609468 RepID=UPI0025F1EFB3|nr:MULTISPECIES: hypothetical protein [unclassified Sphingobacterium]
MSAELILGIIGTLGTSMTIILGVREIRRSKPRFDTSYYFSGGPENDEITLYNASAKNVVIRGYELFWAKNPKDMDQKSISLGREEDCVLFSIPANDSHKIHIDEQYKFKIKGDKNLYIKLQLMGHQKDVIVKVYGNK